RYFRDELDVELGKLPAELLIDFLKAAIGAHFYNRGLYDAQALFASKADELIEAIYALEQPVSPRR
ncbi:MAG: DUF2164 domain-containing protein, partial [Alphaproteobacteria bacterium]